MNPEKPSHCFDTKWIKLFWTQELILASTHFQVNLIHKYGIHLL